MTEAKCLTLLGLSMLIAIPVGLLDRFPTGEMAVSHRGVIALLLQPLEQCQAMDLLAGRTEAKRINNPGELLDADYLAGSKGHVVAC